jgi:putative colanic acid biosynthesis acetyltransferase WcaF
MAAIHNYGWFHRMSFDAMEATACAAAGPEILNPKKIIANPHPLRNRIERYLWDLCFALFYRPSPNVAHKYRVFLLRFFGANVDWTAHPYPRCRIWLPRNLTMGAYSCLANNVDCYNVAPVTLEDFATVSQYSYLCSASHDYTDPSFPLFSKPICLGRRSWVAARAYVGPGVSVGEGAVIGANSCVYKNVNAWTVVGGNPARQLGLRKIMQ